MPSNIGLGLSSHALLSCFILGLKSHIQCEVQALQPNNLTHATGVAKLHESNLHLVTNRLHMHIRNSTLKTGLDLLQC